MFSERYVQLFAFLESQTWTWLHMIDVVTQTQIDVRLVPIMAVLYLLSHIDRANIGNAKIEGMDKDLGLVGNQYNIATTIFFVPYIIFGTLICCSL